MVNLVAQEVTFKYFMNNSQNIQIHLSSEEDQNVHIFLIIGADFFEI